MSEAIGGLTPGTTYHFRLVASNSFGTTNGADTVFTTAGAAVTLATSTGTSIARHAVTLSGRVASARANESVGVFAQRFASGSFAAIATVLTDATGRWSLVVRPARQHDVQGHLERLDELDCHGCRPAGASRCAHSSTGASRRT